MWRNQLNITCRSPGGKAAMHKLIVDFDSNTNDPCDVIVSYDYRIRGYMGIVGRTPSL
ncbi:hypothetical protein K503DRAFT_768269 [Rhizopogon vinicolor AM-OR11-026]|uniref:Uncharacterized protein n=1 Tax=Rhizopogon vinicolor AM-OR11-026 TaxID=1314800 RepID=A0A1B7N7G2_9AGAM|nr:hypothetical protein K503DRAFT_768269 [Rhizopogon vinicolor AM-OR11-026]